MPIRSKSTDSPPRRSLRAIFFFGLSVIVIALSAFISQYFWRETGLRTLQAINGPRIELIASGVRAEINRQDHLPILLALDADVRRALADPRDAALLQLINHKLQRIVSEADTRALYVIGRDGIVLAA